jgi:oxygen-independent coproporphyrinogen-3 oxidase
MSAFGVYIHWPYCAAKCPYCDFNSHVRESFSEARWAAAILSELKAVAALQETRPPVSSIFFGGGTPSLMSGRAVAAVIDGIAAIWPLERDAEISLEANPNSVEQTRFRDYRAAGVNRVSIGVQALDDAALKSLGRLHGAEEARNAIRLARDIFPRVSFDLIYARPGQTENDWKTELEQALTFGTEHLSLYQLTIEPGTAYATLARQGKLSVPVDDDAASLYELTEDLCAAAGRSVYEISNYAAPGAECRHNLIYWRYQDYAGVGPGAHGRITRGSARFSTQAERLPEHWLEKVERLGSSLTVEEIPPADAAREHLLMGMRLSEGVDLDAYTARWGRAIAPDKIARLAEDGAVTLEGNRLAATRKGRLLLNTIIAELAD